MRCVAQATSLLLRALLVGGLLVCVGSCESDSGDDAFTGRVLVLSAFPAELVPLLEQATIESTMEIDGRPFRVGTLGGVRVVLGITLIGIANAAATSRAFLDQFDDIVGVVFSGVAGSSLRIGDVTVPLTWELADGTSFPSDPGWLGLAEEISAPGVASLDECTELPSDPNREPVCLTVPPVIVVGGVGHSSGFEAERVGCQPDGGDVFGCDVPAADGAAAVITEPPIHSFASPGAEAPIARNDAEAPIAQDGGEAPIAQDMETAAVAREAAARGLRFIAFRAVSDGAGDPLGLPGFPAQFFAYYRLAARNAAGATIAFLERLSTGS